MKLLYPSGDTLLWLCSQNSDHYDAIPYCTLTKRATNATVSVVLLVKKNYLIIKYDNLMILFNCRGYTLFNKVGKWSWMVNRWESGKKIFMRPIWK